MNRVYEVGEGARSGSCGRQPFLTLVLVVLTAAVLLALVVTGLVTAAIGDQDRRGLVLQLAWNIAKWPVMFLVVVPIVALLYATPTRQPGFRWVSVGAPVAIVTWGVVSAAFGFSPSPTSPPTTRPTERSPASSPSAVALADQPRPALRRRMPDAENRARLGAGVRHPGRARGPAAAAATTATSEVAGQGGGGRTPWAHPPPRPPQPRRKD